MSALDNNPITTNWQSALNFSFKIQRAPSLSYQINSVKGGSITNNPVKSPTPYLNIPQIGDHLIYEPITFNFKVDSALQNYLEIHNWMTALTNPSGDAKGLKILENNPDWLGYGIKTNLLLFLLDSQQNPKFVFTFEDAFPTNLSGLGLQSTDTNVNYIPAEVTFQYIKYDIKPI